MLGCIGFVTVEMHGDAFAQTGFIALEGAGDLRQAGDAQSQCLTSDPSSGAGDLTVSAGRGQRLGCGFKFQASFGDEIVQSFLPESRVRGVFVITN